MVANREKLKNIIKKLNNLTKMQHSVLIIANNNNYLQLKWLGKKHLKLQRDA